MPVVTTFDPDGIVARHGLGQVAASPVELVSHLKGVLGDQATYARLSEAATRYYLDNHTVEAVSRRFRLAFAGLLSRFSESSSFSSSK